MKVIKPTVLLDTMLTSSSAPETDYADWLAATSYTVGTRVIRTSTHRIYECLVAGIDATLPEDAGGGATPRWLDIGPTNRWAMFDDEIGSSTLVDSALTVVFKPGALQAVALLELVAQSVSVTLKDAPGGAVVYSKTVTDLDGSDLTDIFDWFVVPYEQKTSLVFLDLPDSFTDGELTLTISGTGNVGCGVCKFGPVKDLGGTMYGSKLSIIDYSRKETNDFGRTVIVKRRFAKTHDCKIIFLQPQLSAIFNTLSDLRSTPSVWVGTEMPNYEAMTLYGFYRDFSIDVTYPSYSYCSLKIEGLT